MEIMQYIEVELFSLIWMLKYTQYFMYNENILTEIYIAYCEHTCAKYLAFKHMNCG